MAKPGRLKRRVFGVAFVAMVAVGTLAPRAAAQVSYQEDVFPIIELRCLECHQPGGPGYETSGFDMRTYESLMEGTEFGSVITPGSPFESNLVAVIEHRTSPEIWMPHQSKQLSKCERQAIRFWIAQGARNN